MKRSLAGNDAETETWEALKFMLLPEQGLPPLHAHRTGNVTAFNPGAGGNITIEDVHGVRHIFNLADDTSYRPKGLNELSDPGELHDAVIGHFVTVVIKGDPKLATAEADAIVVHHRAREGWPTPIP